MRTPTHAETPADEFATGNEAAKTSAAAIAAAKKPTPPTPPAPKESEDLAAALERPGDLNLHGLSLNAALFTIGEQWNINIVAGEVQGTVNGVFKQAPLREILDAILLSNGYNYRAVGKSLVVSSVAELGQVNPFFQSATIPVQSADIDEVVEGAQLLNTPKGQVRALKSAHSIVVLDFPDRVKMIREFVATLETAGSGRFPSAESRNGVPLEVGYFRTQHISAKTAEQALQAVLSKEGRVGVMEKEDRLLVTDYAENLAMVEKVLQRIDRPRPQVRITALIYDISLQDIEQLGINWNPTVKGRIDAAGDPQTSLGVDSVTAVPFPTGAVGNTLTFMNLSRNFDITAVAMLLAEANDARLLADPNVAVLENEEAVFEKVEEIPYQQLTQTQQGGDDRHHGLQESRHHAPRAPKNLRRRHHSHGSQPEVSRLIGFTPGDNQPIIDTSSASTVLVRGQSPNRCHRRPAPTQRRRRVQRHSVPERFEGRRPAVPLARHRCPRKRAGRLHHARNHLLLRRAELPPENGGRNDPLPAGPGSRSRRLPALLPSLCRSARSSTCRTVTTSERR